MKKSGKKATSYEYVGDVEARLLAEQSTLSLGLSVALIEISETCQTISAKQDSLHKKINNLKVAVYYLSFVIAALAGAPSIKSVVLLISKCFQ